MPHRTLPVMYSQILTPLFPGIGHVSLLLSFRFWLEFVWINPVCNERLKVNFCRFNNALTFRKAFNYKLEHVQGEPEVQMSAAIMIFPLVQVLTPLIAISVAEILFNDMIIKSSLGTTFVWRAKCIYLVRSCGLDLLLAAIFILLFLFRTGQRLLIWKC